MKVEQVETYIKDKVNEVLGTIKNFEEKVLKDRNDVEGMRDRILDSRKNNGVYTDVKDELIGIQKTHYYSFLLEQDLKNHHIKATELLTQANVFGIDLELEEEDNKAAENILKGNISMFGISSDNKGNKMVNLLDSPLKAQIELGIESRIKDEKELEKIYNDIQPATKNVADD
jgi:hypothetical protein